MKDEVSEPPADRSSQTRDVVKFRTAMRAWFEISLRTFGGPAGQIAVMHRELVDERRWIGEQRFLRALSYCTLLPGPEAQQLAIYLGWLLNGTLGGLVAGTLFVVPGYVALMGLCAIYAAWGATTTVTAIFAGLAPAVLAIVAQAVWRISSRALGNRFLVGLAVATFVALFVFNLSFPLVIGAAALVGYTAGRVRPDLVATKASSSRDGGTAPLIADDALHGERPSWRRAIRILTIGLTLWATPVVIAAIALGRSHVFVDQGLFFSGAAVVTFGGAYACCPTSRSARSTSTNGCFPARWSMASLSPRPRPARSSWSSSSSDSWAPIAARDQRGQLFATHLAIERGAPARDTEGLRAQPRQSADRRLRGQRVPAVGSGARLRPQVTNPS